MCLNRLIEIDLKKLNKKEIIGWKVVRPSIDKYLQSSMFGADIKLGAWNKGYNVKDVDNTSPLITSLSPREEYPVGFHVWASRQAARECLEYTKETSRYSDAFIVKVALKGIVAHGEQGFDYGTENANSRKVYVAKQIKVLGKAR